MTSNSKRNKSKNSIMKNIDIAQIIKDNDSKFLQSLPDFVIKIIAKIIRQNEINRIMNKYSDYEGIDFLQKIIEELNIKIEIDGIKTNIELVLLPRELFRKKGKTIKVSIGKTIHYQEFDNSLSHRDWAQKIRADVYSIKHN